MQQLATDTLLQSLRRLQLSGNYSDLKVFCGEEVFLTHKVIVCPRSEFLAKACQWGNDGPTKGEIDLGNDDPRLVKLMIDYLYLLEYDDNLPQTPMSPAAESLAKQPDSPVARTVKFFEDITSNGVPAEVAEDVPEPRVAWDYGLSPKDKRKKQKQMLLDGIWDDRLTQEMINGERVRAVASSSTEPQFEPERGADIAEHWSSSSKEAPYSRNCRLRDSVNEPDTERLVVNTSVYALADKYGIEDLKLLAKAKFSQAVAKHWKSEAFLRAAKLAFENTPSTDHGIRKEVIDTLYKHQELTDFEETQALLESGNGIAWQLVKVLISRSSTRPATTLDG